MDWEGVGEHGHALLAREKEFRAALAPSLPARDMEFEQAWRDYMLLETFDFLSLLTCFGLESEGCGPVPTAGSTFTDIAVRRDGPWAVSLDPFPFAGDELTVGVSRVRLEAESFQSTTELRELFRAARPDEQPTVYRAA